MASEERNPKVDAYLDRAKGWKDEQAALREIVLARGLTEELKWGVPCYTLDGKNVVLVHAFNEYCAYLFPKGALLPDPDGILVQQTENTQAARQVRFTSTAEIRKLEPTLRKYLDEAIAVQRSGAKVAFKDVSEREMPSELRERLDADPKLEAAFEALTPGRKRGYFLHVSSAKQSKTRAARVEKCIPLILEGKGFDER